VILVRASNERGPAVPAAQPDPLLPEQPRHPSRRPIDPRWITLIDAQLFRAAQAGDTAAHAELWHRLFSVLYTAAIHLGLKLSGNPDAARELASQGWTATYEETNARLEAVVWKGSRSLVSFVWRCLTWRCRDAARRRRRVGRREVGLDEAALGAGRGTTRTGSHANAAGPDGLRTPPDARVSAREVMWNLTPPALASLREALASRRKLLAVVDARVAYLREQLTAALRAEERRNAARMTPGAPVDAAVPEDLAISRRHANAFTMDRLGINRNTLDQRLKRITAIVKKGLA
jgi:hypothetical protein